MQVPRLICTACQVLCRGLYSSKFCVNNVCRQPLNRFAGLTSCEHHYSTCPTGMKVTICGAAGATGQPLALLLKQSPLLDEIALYDVRSTCGYGMELSHVDTKCQISSYSGPHMLCDALKGAKVVVIVARNGCDSFENNAPVITEMALHICGICPDAYTIVATEPVESLVPIVAEILRLRSAYNPRKLLGCVQLNCTRANTVLADFVHMPPESIRVPVIGGGTAQTMVPVLSAAVLPSIMTQEQIECLTSCIMNGTEMVCHARNCMAATPYLAGAYGIARTTINAVMGLQGKKDVAQVAYVDSMGTCAPDCQFFASELILGASGIEKNLGVPELTKFENCLLCNCLPHIRNQIARAVWLVYKMCMECGQMPCQCQPCCCGWNSCSSSPAPAACCQSCCCAWDPCACYPPGCPPNCPPPPPDNWTAECPGRCRDEYLAAVCREMTCRCGCKQLSWFPNVRNYDQVKAANSTNQLPIKSDMCNKKTIPKSVRIEKEYRERAKKYKKC